MLILKLSLNTVFKWQYGTFYIIIGIIYKIIIQKLKTNKLKITFIELSCAKNSSYLDWKMSIV